jgi:hypothetical protein
MSSYTPHVSWLEEGPIFQWNSVDFVFSWQIKDERDKLKGCEMKGTFLLMAAYNHRDPEDGYGKNGAKPLLPPKFLN